MNKRWKPKDVSTFLILVLGLCLLVCVGLYFYLGGYSKGDLIGHWRICKYTLEGYNPYSLIGCEPAIESVGAIPAGFSTVPWSCVFGSVFYGGFLPVDGAAIYIYVLHFLALPAVIATFYKKFQNLLTRKQLVVLSLLPVAHFSFMYSVYYGNAGGIICCLLMIVLCISDEHPITAGVLWGFTLMKPQISAIFGLIYLLKKQWKVLCSAAVVVIAGWIATAVFTQTAPITLLYQTFDKGTAAATQYLGLFNNLKFFGVNSKLILMLNVIVGSIYTLGLYGYLRKKYTLATESFFVYVPACIASTFWIYKNGTDYMILVFAAMFFCVLCIKKELSLCDYLGSILAIGYLQMSRCAVYLGIVLFQDNLFVRDIFKSVDGLIIGLFGIYLCRLWAKYDGESALRRKYER